jgi:hypothetical protein
VLRRGRTVDRDQVAAMLGLVHGGLRLTQQRDGGAGPRQHRDTERRAHVDR